MKENRILLDYAKQAEADYKRALDLNPGLVDVEINYGLLEIYIGAYKKAIKRYERLLKREKNQENFAVHVNIIHVRLAEAYFKEGQRLLNTDESTQSNNQQGKIPEDSTSIGEDSGRYQEAIEHYEKAIGHYEKVIQLGILEGAICKDDVYIGLASSYCEIAMALFLLEGKGDLARIQRYMNKCYKLITEDFFPEQQKGEFINFLKKLWETIRNS